MSTDATQNTTQPPKCQKTKLVATVLQAALNYLLLDVVVKGIATSIVTAIVTVISTAIVIVIITVAVTVIVSQCKSV